MDLYQLAAIVTVLTFLYMLKDSIRKYFVILKTNIKRKNKIIKKNWEYKKRVKRNMINASDYRVINVRVEQGVATNLERDAYFTYRNEHPFVKLKLPKDVLTKINENAIVKQPINMPQIDPRKYLK